MQRQELSVWLSLSHEHILRGGSTVAVHHLPSGKLLGRFKVLLKILVLVDALYPNQFNFFQVSSYLFK